MKKTDPAALIDSQEIAEIIGLNDAHGVGVYRKRADFPVPAVDTGRCVLWDRADIEAWARDNGRFAEPRRPT